MSEVKPAEGVLDNGGGHRKVEIRDFKPLNKNTLKGVFTVTLPSGMVLHSLMLHESGEERWIGLSGKPYTDASGRQTYARIIDFVDRATADRFRDALLTALDAHLAETTQ